MKIGIGLPNTIPGTPGGRLVAWAERAEERGFSGLATIDRVVYPNYDSITALAAAAGATSEIELMTNILLGPVYPPALLAKSAASLDQLSGGRFTLGIAPGGREDDYVATGTDFHTRGRALDAALGTMHAVWRGEAFDGSDKRSSPTPVNGDRVPVMIGGTSDRSMRRAATWGAGWTMGGGSADMAGPLVEKLRAAWSDARRDDQPRVAALAYFSLGAEVEDDSRGYLRHYYSYLGEYADMIADGALRSEEAIAEAVSNFAAVGVTELYFDATTTDLEQLDRLADVVTGLSLPAPGRS